jgi:hypothetical protein
MNVDAPGKCIPVFSFQTFEPDDSGHDHGRGRRAKNFTCPPSTFKTAPGGVASIFFATSILPSGYARLPGLSPNPNFEVRP